MLQPGWKSVLAVGNQGIAQALVSTAAYRPALGKGFPSVSALPWPDRASLAKLLKSVATLRECFPSQSLTALVCSDLLSLASPVKL